jgi:D-alanine-D-alanine ligase
VTPSPPVGLDEVIEKSGRVGVLMGGASAEREISLKSGQEVLRGLLEAGVDAHAVDWNGMLGHDFIDNAFDRYFIALHGRGGEDGQIQAVLDLMGVPYTGTRVLGCSLAMDKIRAKLTFFGAGLPTPPFEVIRGPSDAGVVIEKLGLPLIIKPAREGSSLGIAKVGSAAEFEEAFEKARQFDDAIFAERWIEGRDYTLSIVGGTALPMIRVETPHEFYDYAAKYVDDTTRYICPCGLSGEEERLAAELALAAFQTLDGRGWGRVDFMRGDDGRMWLIEINTVPGMTDHSLVPMAARQAGMSFEELVLSILASSF